MSKTNRELIEFCREKLGTPYVFGMKGQILTQELLAQLARENPKVYTPQYIEKARKYIGRRCTDCSGLISWCTGILRGSANYKETACEIRPASALDETMTGWALWKPGHIGVYVGNGRCIEAKGINYGTVETAAASTPWVSALKLKDIDYFHGAVEAQAANGAGADAPSAAASGSSFRPHATGWTNEEGGVRFYLDPGRYVANDWYEDGGRWFWFDGSGHAVRDNWYLYKDNWYYFGSDFAMVKGIQIIKGKPYYFGEDGKLAKLGTRFVVQVDKNGVLHFPGENSSEMLETGAEGKSPALAAFERGGSTGNPVPAAKAPVTARVPGSLQGTKEESGAAGWEDRHISDAGICLIRQFEGCRLEAYRCAAGVPTIGYGHTAGVAMGMKITQAEAERYLREDVRSFEHAVNRALTRPVSQNQFDALVSFAYNLGAGALRGSTLLKLLNAGDINGAADEFPKWNKAAGKVLEGLTKRRMKERQLFLS